MIFSRLEFDTEDKYRSERGKTCTTDRLWIIPLEVCNSPNDEMGWRNEYHSE